MLLLWRVVCGQVQVGRGCFGGHGLARCLWLVRRKHVPSWLRSIVRVGGIRLGNGQGFGWIGYWAQLSVPAWRQALLPLS